MGNDLSLSRQPALVTPLALAPRPRLPADSIQGGHQGSIPTLFPLYDPKFSRPIL